MLPLKKPQGPQDPLEESQGLGGGRAIATTHTALRASGACRLLVGSG